MAVISLIYTTVTISGYNASPPPDDGSQTSANIVQWSKHKLKIGDPIKTGVEAVNAQLLAGLNVLALAPVTSLTSSATMAEANWNTGQLKTATGGNLNFPAPSSLENGWTQFAYNGSPEEWHLVATASTSWRRRDGNTASEVILSPGVGIQVLNTATCFLPIGIDSAPNDLHASVCYQMFN